MTKEALKLALEALEYHTAQTRPIEQTNEAITAIKEALAQPHEMTFKEFDEWICDDPHYLIWVKEQEDLALEQEPVAFASHGVVNWIADKQFQHEALLYSAPQRRWVGLTDEEVDQFHNWKDCTWSTNELVRYVQQTLKDKNT